MGNPESLTWTLGVNFCFNFAVSGSHSRLHLLDLGSCESDLSQTRDGGRGQCLSLGALGNVILALANGAKHVPYRYVFCGSINQYKPIVGDDIYLLMVVMFL